MRPKNPIQTVLIAVGVVVFLMLCNAIGLLRPVESLIGVLLKPIAGIAGLDSDSELEQQNRELQGKVDDLTAQLAQREEAKRENDSLRAQLGFAQNNNFNLVQADIISQDPSNYQQFLTINRGSSAGLQKGMTVVSQGLLVGRIIDTTATTAKVYLITDSGSAVPVIAQATRATGLIRGERGFGLALTMVAQTDKLQPDDTVITSGFGGDYPRGLVVGTIGAITQKDAEVFQTAVIKPAIDFRKLEGVFVITGSKS